MTMSIAHLANSTNPSQIDMSTEKEDPSMNQNTSVANSFADPEIEIEKQLTQTEGTQSPAFERQYTSTQWIAVCAALYISAFLYGLDTTIVADIQAAAVETFGNVGKLGWLGIGFPLGSIATILSLSKAFGIFNTKWLYISSLIMFEAGSALCGGSPNINALIVGRVWAGAGGAGMYLGILNLLSANTSIQERSIYVSACGAFWGVGTILGPVIGGSFADSSATWRWAFYINLVLFAVCSPIYFLVVKSFNPQPDISFGEKLKHIDWLGVVLNAAVYTTFVMVFTFGGTQWAWDDNRTIAMFVVFGVILILFVVTQRFSILTTPSHRLFPVDFLSSRSLILLYISQSAVVTGLFIPIYYIPLFFSFVYGDSGVQAAVRLLPFICITIFFVMVNGFLMPRYGYYQPWFFVAGIFLTIGGALMYSLVDVNTSKSAIYGYSILCAIGAGLAQQAAYSVAPIKVDAHRIADAVGFINAAQIGASTIALTITSAVFQNVGYKNVQQALQGLDFSSEDIHAALAGAQSDVFTSVSQEVREKVVDGIVRAIGEGYILVIAAGAVAIVAAALMKRERLFNMEVGAGA